MSKSILHYKSEANCPFCKVRDGELRASIIFDEPLVYAMMSIEQPNPYTVLVIPKPHVPTIFDLSDELAAEIFQATVRLSKAVLVASGCAGINLVQSNMEAGQQDIFHFHLHILPRFKGDGIRLDWDNSPADRRVLDQLAAEIRKRL